MFAYLSTECALDLVLILYDVTNLDRLFLVQIFDSPARIQTGFLTDLTGRCRSDTEYICKTYDKPLIVRDIYTCDSCHRANSFPTARALTLTLLVTLVFANHSNDALATDDLAIRTHFLD